MKKPETRKRTLLKKGARLSQRSIDEAAARGDIPNHVGQDESALDDLHRALSGRPTKRTSGIAMASRARRK